MYRKDVFEAKGLTMPANPTWDQVAQLAAQADGGERARCAASACAGRPGGARSSPP